MLSRLPLHFRMICQPRNQPNAGNREAHTVRLPPILQGCQIEIPHSRCFAVGLLYDLGVGLIVMAECLHVELAYPNSEARVQPLVALVCCMQVY